jgi:hypothetical protein
VTDDQPKSWLPSTTSDCPVDKETQGWTESSIRWFLGQFGTEVIYRDPVLPTSDLLPGPGYTASASEIEELVTRVCELMQVDPGSFALELYDGTAEKEVTTPSGQRHAVGHFRITGDRLVIALDQHEASDPGKLTAIAVHELCHLRLRGESRNIRNRGDEERLTDLLTVFFGFGIFTTNAAMMFKRTHAGFTIVSHGLLDDRTLNAASHNDGYRRLGYLSSAEFGYALACYCWVRGETELPHWARYVNPGPRVPMEQGLAYLRRTTRRPAHIETAPQDRKPARRMMDITGMAGTGASSAPATGGTP